LRCKIHPHLRRAAREEKATPDDESLHLQEALPVQIQIMQRVNLKVRIAQLYLFL
jgi:hypothetical protein